MLPAPGGSSESPQPSDDSAEAAAPDAGAPGVQRDWSRRRFLSMAAAGAAAFLAACGRERAPTPTPGPSPIPTQARSPLPVGRGKTYLPWIENGGGSQAALAEAATATSVPPTAVAAAPTETPTETPTATPELPTPTPTPPATPFPPGPPSKLGLFVARNDPQLFDLLKTQAVTVVKTLELDGNFLAQIKQVSPRTLVVARIDLPQIDLSSLDPLPAAREFANKVIPLAEQDGRMSSVDGWESYNEPVAGSADEMKRFGDFEAERTRLLAERGIRSVVGNFGTGQPPLEWWPSFFPALQAVQAHNGWLGLHEYSAPTIYFNSTVDGKGRYPGVTPADTGWLTLRYRKVYNDILIPAGLRVPLIFTELGVDGLVTDRPGPPDARGWQDFQAWWAENGYGLWGPGAYVEQLVWYDAAMRQDDYVVGGTIYALAASDGWHSYDIHGPAAAVLGQYLGVHAPA